MRHPSLRRAAILALCALVAAIIYWIPTTVTTPAVLNIDGRLSATPGPAEATPVTAPEETSEPEATSVTDEQIRRRPPSSVYDLRLASNTLETFTVAWDAASDEFGVASYQVLMNGFAAVLTTATEVTLRWPQGDENVLIQVSAINTRGNQGEWRSLVIIPPPTASSTPTPTTPTPTPTYSGTKPSMDDPDEPPSRTPTPTVSSTPSSGSSTPAPTATATATGARPASHPAASSSGPDETPIAGASIPSDPASPGAGSSRRTQTGVASEPTPVASGGKSPAIPASSPGVVLPTAD